MPTSPPDHHRPSFLDRQTWGLSNWLLLAMAAVFVLAFVPRGVRLAIQSNVNQAEDWLPADYPESTDLRWFARHYIGAKFALISWEGCTLDAQPTIARVVAELDRERDGHGHPVYEKILTGPAQIASLTTAPSNLSRSQAIRRIEGALVGPRPADAALVGEDASDGDASDQQATDDGSTDGAGDREWELDKQRTTCIVAYLTPYMTENNQRMRKAIERARDIVVQQAGVTPEQVHMGGPPVDNITIDIEGEKTLLRLAGFSGVVGLLLSYWCFRSLRLTWNVFAVSGISAGVSLAIVYWYGVFEINALGYPKKHLGTVDAILMSMPAVVYVLGLSGAIHIINYYKDERDARGQPGAVERGVRIGWGPCALAALTTAVGLGSLGASHIIPIKKFGIFTASGVLATVLVLLTLLPISLHLFPPKLPGDDKKKKQATPSHLPPWAAGWAQFVTRRYGVVAAGCVALMGLFAVGLTKIDTEVRLLKLLDPSTSLIRDYGWFEEHLGNLVPMEVIVALDDDQLRAPDERADEGDRYRMTMLERLKLTERLQKRIETLEPVSRAMSAATFGPQERSYRSGIERNATEFTISTALEENRGALAEYVTLERESRSHDRAPLNPGGVEQLAEERKAKRTGRELWRISARVAALSDIDYGDFVGNLQHQVEPVLDAYRLRDKLLAALKEQGKGLVGSRIAVAFAGPADAARPAEGSQDHLLSQLLVESDIERVARGSRGKVSPLNIAQLSKPDNAERYARILASYDAVVTTSPQAAKAVKAFTDEVAVVSLEEQGVETVATRTEANAALEPDASLAAVYTGIVPLVYKTQRELMDSLRTSIMWATVLIACVMVVVLRSPGGGVVSMIPNVFPVVTVFGAIGWLGIKVDIGIMMTASVALGVAVDDTIHFLTWFRRGIVQGLDRQSATLLAFDRCALAMTQTTLIAGLGLAVFATSTFTPTQEFGYLMITMLGAALVGDLVLLPALLCGPLGRFFAPGAPPTPEAAGSLGSPTRASVMTAEQPNSLGSGDPSYGASDDADDGPTILPIADASPATIPLPSREDSPDQPSETADSTEREDPPADEPLSPANAALRKKLQQFRRS